MSACMEPQLNGHGLLGMLLFWHGFLGTQLFGNYALKGQLNDITPRLAVGQFFYGTIAKNKMSLSI